MLPQKNICYSRASSYMLRDAEFSEGEQRPGSKQQLGLTPGDMSDSSRSGSKQQPGLTLGDMSDSSRPAEYFGGQRPVAYCCGPTSAASNSWTQGSTSSAGWDPQVSPPCDNYGRRGGRSLCDCPHGSTRYRDFSARVREGEHQTKHSHQDTPEENLLVSATKGLRIGGTEKPRRRRSVSREKNRKYCSDREKIRHAGCGNGETSRNGSPRRKCVRAGSPCRKRARAGSSSRKYYFSIDRKISDGNHSRYSSCETIWAVDEDRCPVETAGEIMEIDPPGEKTMHQQQQTHGSDVENDESSETDSNNNFFSVADENDNGSMHAAPSDESHCRSFASAAAEKKHNESEISSSSNASSCGEWSVRGENGSDDPRAEIRNGGDIHSFLELLQKVTNLPVATQAVIVRQVVAEREKLSGSKTYGPRVPASGADPVQDYSELVEAIAHLPMKTQNIVLFGITAEREQFGIDNA